MVRLWQILLVKDRAEAPVDVDHRLPEQYPGHKVKYEVMTEDLVY